MNNSFNNTEKHDLNKIFNQFDVKISHLSRRMIDNEDIAREAAQETWLQIVKGINSFKGESELSTWIYTIAKRTIIRYAKNEKKYDQNAFNNYFQKNPITPPDFSEIEEILWVKETCDKCLTGILHCLNNEDRLLYIFREILDIAYLQLVDIFDTAEQNLRKRVSRARKKLRQYLTDQCYLINPSGTCLCNNKKYVKHINLKEEYSKITNTIKKVNHFREIAKILPKKNYWLDFQKKN